MLEYRTYVDKNGRNCLKKMRKIQWKGMLNTPKKIEEFMKKEYQMEQLAEEYAYIIAVDTSSKIIGVFEVAHGTNQQIQMSNREIFIRLCLCGATSFFLVHNHPSGETIPSKSDISNTQEVKKAGELMGIELLDHIIIGKDYCSFREHNLL